MKRITYTDIMKIYRWIDARKDSGLGVRACDIQRAWGFSYTRCANLRQSYLDSRGVYFGQDKAA